MRNKILEHVLAIIDLSEKEQDEFLSILKEIKIAKKSTTEDASLFFGRVSNVTGR